MKENKIREKNWAEEHGATVFGVGVFVMLGFIVILMRVFG